MHKGTLTNKINLLLARVMQLTFKKQVQEWKDVLLRRYDPYALEQHEEAFHQEETAVALQAAELRAAGLDDETRSVVDQFISAHQSMSEKYAAALRTSRKATVRTRMLPMLWPWARIAHRPIL